DDIVGEVNIVLEDKPYNFYAITTKPSKLLQIPKEDFFKTCTRACVSNSAVIHNLMQVLARKADTLSSRVQLLSTGSLRQRVSKYLVENSDEQFNVELKMNREQLAEYLNVTRPALSKELLTMQSEGLIALEKHKVIIKNFNSLAENT
ncbi:MAG: Crp/Fnr family transcriptional regulator, partial [Oscillospiraceae bacterium]